FCCCKKKYNMKDEINKIYDAHIMKTADKKKVVFESFNQVIDENTGELLSSKKVTKVMLPQEPAFVKLYLQDVMKIMNLTSSCKDVLFAFLPTMGYNNVIAAQKYVKEMICEQLGIKMNTLNKAIDTMSKEGVLVRKGRGIYVVNPQIIAKGKWEDIQEIRLQVTYDQDGNRTISHEKVKRIEPQYKLL
ncbi:replication/maintenance protein RepL, partial [Arthrospira platensis SPKY1]|nr:replication/maintenance protein RepL [Arthrospira platensis SPKY1]